MCRAGVLTLLGQITLPGEPFEMYRRGELLVTMANGAAADTTARMTYHYGASAHTGLERAGSRTRR